MFFSALLNNLTSRFCSMFLHLMNYFLSFDYFFLVIFLNWCLFLGHLEEYLVHENNDQSDIELENITNTPSIDGASDIEPIDNNTETQTFSKFEFEKYMIVRYFMCNQTQDVETQRKF